MQLLCQFHRSYKFTNTQSTPKGEEQKYFDPELGIGHLFYIKRHSKHNYIQRTRWNRNCVRSCWTNNGLDHFWNKVQDREPITWHRRFSDDEQMSITVIHRNHYVTPTTFFTVIADSTSVSSNCLTDTEDEVFMFSSVNYQTSHALATCHAHACAECLPTPSKHRNITT